MIILDIFIHPLKEISRDKKNRSIHRTLSLLLLSSFLLSFSVFHFRDFFSINGLFLFGLIIFWCSFLFILFFALLFQMVMYILKSINSYYLSLTALTVGFFVFSSGMFLTSLFSLLGDLGDIWGMFFLVINSIIYIFSFLFSVVLTLRATELFFKADLVTALFVYILVFIAFGFSFLFGFSQMVLFVLARIPVSNGQMFLF